MTTLTPAAFRTRYAAFDADTYPDLTVQSTLNDVVLEMSETQWGTLYARGAYALTAHLLTVNSATSGASYGGIKSRSIGDVSVTFADGSAALEDLGSTKYGAEYIRLQKMISGGPVIV